MNDCTAAGIRYNMESEKGMRVCRIYSYKYNVDIAELIILQLKKAALPFSIAESGETYIEVMFLDAYENLFINALCDLLVCDIAPFELVDMINELPLDYHMSKAVLKNSIAYAKKAVMKYPIREALTEYFKENESLVIEGFIMFRMQSTREIWERCVEKAAEDSILLMGQSELAALLYEIIKMCCGSEIVLILRDDGTCTIIDAQEKHIDYPKESCDNVLGMLCAMSPDTVTVYDMANGKQEKLLAAVSRLFGEKVRVYKTVLH